jgi:tetratricopeptide (TPR) repeat protein
LRGRVWRSRNKAGELIRANEVDVTQRFIATFWVSATTERFFGLFTVPDVDPQCGESLYWIDTPSRCVEVLALLDTVLDAEPSNLKALWWRGFLLFRSGHRADAVDCYDRMLRVDADDERTWLAKAVCLERLQRFNEAIECYDRMGSAEVLSRKARALAAIGRLEEPWSATTN